MYKIKTYNKISKKGLDRFEENNFQVSGDDLNAPDAIVLRSHNLKDYSYPNSVKAVGRAGAGVNNIDIKACTEKGIVVFNTPGANANAVKELVLTGLLLSGRDILGGIEFLKKLDPIKDNLKELVESNKSKFNGIELKNKTLGVVGLGAIGMQVANSASGIGMSVQGYDPYISVFNAWQISRDVKPSQSLDQMLPECDFISVHVPLLDSTSGFFDKAKIGLMKKGSVLLNFSRPEVVSEDDIIDALDSGRLRLYVTDFPTAKLLQHPKVICMPHLGASTKEAEENCAIMVAEQLKDFLLDGNIRNSVNFPECVVPRKGEVRITISNKNVPNMVSQITSTLGNAGMNIESMVNKSRSDLAYNIIDVAQEPSKEVLSTLKKIDGVLVVRVI